MIEAHDLTVRYADGTGLGPWSLSLRPGVHVLQGPNGCGKSTLLGALAASLRRTSGSVIVAGGDPEHDAATRAKVGYLTAEPSLPAFLTVREVWRMHAALRGHPDWDGRPYEDALALPPSRRLAQCSSGMRQKAELLAALAGDPEVLLLDEPFTNLDDGSVAWLQAHLSTRGGTVLIAHHGALWHPAPAVHRLDAPR